MSYFNPKVDAKEYTGTDIIHLGYWAAQECEWQRSGEYSVGRLIETVMESYMAQQADYGLNENLILVMGASIDSRNLHGYRREPVWVNGQEMPRWGDLPMMMGALVDLLPPSTPAEAFETFEKIHPFVDGNGRVGAIIYNWLNGTLHPGKLEFPPNVFGDPRRG